MGMFDYLKFECPLPFAEPEFFEEQPPKRRAVWFCISACKPRSTIHQASASKDDEIASRVE
jgi:hypothetical protein